MVQPERIDIAQTPTPLVRLERLGRELGGANVWMKRDDLTGVEFSGNKIRKLEYVLADALANSCDALVTEGTCQSNHCRATAAVCAKFGLHCTLLLRPEPPSELQGNYLLDLLFGAETRAFGRDAFEADRPAIIENVLEELRGQGRKPRFTPMGASEPLGCWGYIRAMEELGGQLRAAGVGPCDLVVALSSGGTYAGLLLGKLLHGLDNVRIIAVPVSDDVTYHRRALLTLCRQAIEVYDLPIEVRGEMFEFADGYVGRGYAIPYDEAIRAINLLTHTEAIVLDPVYTGKAFTAFIDRVRDGRLGRDRPAVFLHTGGVFSNFAWPRLLTEGTASLERSEPSS